MGDRDAALLVLLAVGGALAFLAARGPSSRTRRAAHLMLVTAVVALLAAFAVATVIAVGVAARG